MSALRRLFNVPATRRSYSSYFSSKSGGGRYFNSAKAPKNGVVAANAPAKPDASVVSEAQSEGTPSSSPLSETKSTSPVSSTSSATPAAGLEAHKPSGTPADLTSAHADAIPQLQISAKDFKMHQFFSLHRPLLLINQPTSIFRGVAPGQALLGPSPSQVEASVKAGQHLGLDAPLDPFIDADAEAARQLTRALTMARAESALSWEKTLKHLGLDVSKDADRIGLQEQFEKEWAEVLLDSTKRKRRKKMKKHKLKKRRRATRAERLKLK